MSDAAAAAGQAPIMVEVKVPAAPPPAAGAPGVPPAAAPAQTPAPPAPPSNPADPGGEGKEADPPPAPLNVDPPKPPPKEDAPTDAVVEYNPTGNDRLDLALAFIGDRGFGPDRADVKAAMQGDFGPLEASLKELGPKAKGYERYIAAGKAAHAEITDARKAKDTKAQEAVVTAVGGAAVWNAIHAWVVAEADEGERKQINAAFNAGPLAAAAMAKELAEAYKRSGKSTQPAKSAVKEDAAKGAADTSGVLTRQQYQAEIARLTAKYGSRAEYTPEFQAANAARSRGRSIGA